ncbi:MAG: type II toxin-antitoxin system VapC family toxin [Candidatus Micrarchaeales archaeon]
MIVVDASSIVKLLLKEPSWEDVGTYLKEELCSVNSCVLEATNAIWVHYHSKEITHGQALSFFKVLEKLQETILLEAVEHYVGEGLKITLKEDISIYDAVFIAAAKDMGELLTSDKLQRDIAINSGIKTFYIR